MKGALASVFTIFICLLTSCSSSRFDNLEFEPLFRGEEDISKNWIGNLKGYKVVDGAMVTQPKAGNIYTAKQYQDYVFRFEFKLPSGGNNGIGLRAGHPDDSQVGKDVAYSSVELQILDNTHKAYAKLKPWQFHGSAYGLVAAARNGEKEFLNPVGHWNVQEVYLKKNHLVVRLNGTVILDADLSMAQSNASPYNKKMLGGGRNRGAGHIAFAGHGKGIAFRNISVAELEDDYSLPHTDDNEPPEGFTALFNGDDLSGWKGVMLPPNDKPHNRAKLTEEQKEGLQTKANEVMNKHWSVTDEGELFFDGKKGGFSLATAKQYGNFEMYCSYKIEPKGDSGIYLRGLPQVQIWDPADKGAHKHGADKGSGGLWNNKEQGRWPLVKADNPAGEWNHFFIRMIGTKVTIWLNGNLIINDAPLENLWEPGKPIPLKEQIELQCHGHPIWFKNIYIKELP